tara:strand:- start:643 stop:1335 length:693 start_codon:yes stop_codon:yes gene_type:complete
VNEQSKESPASMPLFGFLLVFVGMFLYIGIKMNSQVSLANLSIVLGVFWVAVAGYTLAKPVDVGQALRAFPRANAPGYVLMLAATAWFLWNIKIEDMADYREIKHWFYIGFGAVGVGSCIFLRDFLAVRGLAVFMLLLAKLMLDTQRDYMLAAPEAHMSEWRLVFTVWAYAIIFMCMWWVISPWRMRDMIEWMLAKPGRLAAKGWFRLGFGILLIALGLTVFGIPDAAAN